MKKSNKNLSKLKTVPDYHVYISYSNGKAQYYLKTEAERRKYVRKKDIKNITKFAQKDYEQEMNMKLKLLEKNLTYFLKMFNFDIANEYEGYSDAKKAIIKPLILSDKQFIEEWNENHPGMQNPYPEKGMYLTNRGEMVRSKSEKIIADALDKYNIPYQYEPMLELGYSMVYPDFVALNIRTRQTIYWEHLGLLSDQEYAMKNFIKLQNYEKNGYLLGRDLITTMESPDNPIKTNLVEKKIREFLM